MLEIKEIKYTDIVDSIPIETVTNFKPYYNRYYTNKFYIPTKRPDSKNFHSRVAIHTNKLMVIYIADGHDVMKEKNQIESVSFQTKNNVDRKDVKPRGKHKKGAQKMEPNTILCQVMCNGQSYPVYSGVQGKLIEVNEELLKRPQLCVDDNKEKGYIAIIIPEMKKVEIIEENLTAEEEYFKLIQNSMK